jgi:antitoxin component HigA of HigAB toxin-antitoxin module
LKTSKIVPSVSPQESLKSLMAEDDLKRKDIWPVLGNKGAATELLSGRRAIARRKQNAWLLTSGFR